MEEEYTGNFVFTKDEKPKGIGNLDWQSLWNLHSEQLRKGEIALDVDGKIPQLLHKIYYSKTGWEYFGEKLPIRQIDEVQFSFRLKEGSQFGNLNSIKDVIKKGVGIMEIEGKQYFAILPKNTSFIRCEIKGLIIHQIYAKGADYSGSVLSKFEMYSCNFHGSKFIKVKGYNCIFSSSELDNSDFRHARFLNPSFSSCNLISTNFEEVKLINCSFQGSDLRDTRLNYLDLSQCIFSNKSLYLFQVRGSILFSAHNTKNKFSFEFLRVYPEESSLYNNDLFFKIEQNGDKVPVNNILIGVNGIMSPFDKSVSFFDRRVEPDDMRGESLDIVIDNIKRARWQLGFSFFLLGIFAWFAIFNKDIGLNDTIHLSKNDFLEHSWVWPFINSVILVLVAQNMKTALDNTRSLRKRNDVAQVAAFPFPLCHYNRPPSKEHEEIKGKKYSAKWFGLYAIYSARAITGLFYVFHPLLLSVALVVIDLGLFGNSALVLLLWTVVIFFLCLWVFNLSQGFQVPILFDPTEEEEKS
jgi:uncharacterized protein YjbI with pentapeptide repeats